MIVAIERKNERVLRKGAVRRSQRPECDEARWLRCRGKVDADVAYPRGSSNAEEKEP
jgi:hypothetical protein